MWPAKKAIGAQLSYGVRGNALLRLHEALAEKIAPELVFPREDDGPSLYRVGNSHTSIVSAQKSAGDEVDTVSTVPPRNMFKNALFYVPRDIMRSQLFEGAAVLDPTAYDPVYGKLVAFVTTPTGMAVAYSTGETGLVLGLALLKPHRRTKLDPNQDLDDYFMVPGFTGKPLLTSFSEPIKAVETSKGLVAVRTDASIYVMKSEVRDDMLKWKMLGDIPCGDLAGRGFADVSFCPSDQSMLACVDIKGNFGVWRINPVISLGNRLEKVSFDDKDITIEFKETEPEESVPENGLENDAENSNKSYKAVRPSIQDESDLSNWKRICWCQHHNSLLVLSRTMAVQFQVLPKLASSRLVTSNTFSRIRDFVRPEKSSKYAFMLTSKELIWFRLTDRLERLLSWKHFLLDSDPSLKLNVTVCDRGKTFLCLVYSQLSPIIFMYSFGIRDGLPHSLKDPYFFDASEASSPLRYLVLVETEKTLFRKKSSLQKTFCMFELGVNGALTFDVFNSDDGVSFDTHTNFSDSLKATSNGTAFVKAVSPRIKYSNMEMRLRDLAQPMLAHLKNGQTMNDLEVLEIQNYALRLGEKVSLLTGEADSAHASEFPSYRALLEIANRPPLSVGDLLEFDSMVEQLGGFYQSNGIKLKSLVSELLLNRGLLGKHNSSLEDEVEALGTLLGNIYTNDLLGSFNSDASIKKSSILLAASLTKAYAADIKDFYTQRFEDALSEAPEETKAILNKWTSVEDEVPEPAELIFASQAPPVITSAPTINISSQKAPKNKSKKSIRSGFDLRSKGLQNSSQPASQSGYVPSPLSQAQAPQSSQTAEEGDFPSQSASQVVSSQVLPSRSSPVRTSSQPGPSQKRMGASQLMGSQPKKKKKKKKGGFA